MFSILIVVDMQNDFISGSLGSSSAKDIVDNVLKKIVEHNKKGSLIVATQDTHKEDYLKTFEGINLPIEHCIEGTPGHEIAKEIKAVFNNDVIYLKKETFGSLALANVILEHLKNKNIDVKNVEIELVGLCTDICVISNAILLRSAFPNNKITVDSSCCAGTSVDSHNATLLVMKSCQINVV